MVLFVGLSQRAFDLTAVKCEPWLNRKLVEIIQQTIPFLECAPKELSENGIICRFISTGFQINRG